MRLDFNTSDCRTEELEKACPMIHYLYLVLYLVSLGICIDI